MSAFAPFVPLALIGDVGGLELLVILGAVLMLFGGKGMPGIARSFGRMADTLRRASQEFKDQLMDGERGAVPGSPEPDSMKPYEAPDPGDGSDGLQDAVKVDPPVPAPMPQDPQAATDKTSREVLSHDPAG
jgi:sec-independent protein translocase protein TatA